VDQFAQGVVHRRPGDLGQSPRRAGVHLVGGQVHVVSVEDLGDDAALCGQAPAAFAKPLQEITHASTLAGNDANSRADIALDVTLP
jgi:hypothetical protein